MLTEAYGDEILSRAHVFEWNMRFTGGTDSVEDDERAGCTRLVITHQNIVKIRDMGGFPMTSVVRLLINTTKLKC
ncbi:hypothetical protein TNCV_947901 [Trichonephila clavipes]|nr:hypothetical protein TNCV_947901 [Trichonephila clavipes]